MAAGDINMDGWLDLLVGFSGGNGDAAVYINNKSVGATVFDGWTPYTASTTPSVALADLDGDSHFDHVFAVTNGGHVSIFWGRENQVTPGAALDVAATRPSAVVIGHLDSDGRPDLVTVSDEGVVEVIQNLGGRSFQRFQPLSVGTNRRPRHVAIGEINGDGFVNTLDLVVFIGDFGVACGR